jgi:putative chitinase
MDLNKLSTRIPKSVVDQIPEVMSKFKIDTPLRLSHFLAQCAHESGNFKATVENLNYSKEGLMKVFKKYFPNETLAKQYERKPNAIANRVYANRMGNGDENSNQGASFKGRGYIQLTGKDNYSAFDKFVDEDILSNPDLVATKYPLLSAAWFWNSRNLNTLADKGATDDDVTSITKKVNGGTHGLADRISKFKLFYNELK